MTTKSYCFILLGVLVSSVFFSGVEPSCSLNSTMGVINVINSLVGDALDITCNCTGQQFVYMSVKSITTGAQRPLLVAQSRIDQSVVLGSESLVIFCFTAAAEYTAPVVINVLHQETEPIMCQPPINTLPSMSSLTPPSPSPTLSSSSLTSEHSSSLPVSPPPSPSPSLTSTPLPSSDLSSQDQFISAIICSTLLMSAAPPAPTVTVTIYDTSKTENQISECLKDTTFLSISIPVIGGCATMLVVALIVFMFALCLCRRRNKSICDKEYKLSTSTSYKNTHLEK